MHYKVTIKNWFIHNPKQKKGHAYFMVSKRIFNHEKISNLKPIEFQLYMYLLSICADMVSNELAISHQMIPKYMRISSKSLSNHLNRLQQLQLLDASHIPSLYTRQDITLHNKTKQDKKSSEVAIISKNDELKKQAAEIWQAYKEAYLQRYKVEPIRNAAVNSKISQLAKRLGQHGPDVVKFFLTHNDQYYLKTTHAIGGCLTNAESLLTQMLRGKAVTGLDARSAEKSINVVSQAEMFRRMSEQV